MIIALGCLGAVLVLYYGPAVLERLMPLRWQRRFQRSLGTPGGVLMSKLPGWVLLETTGRRSGLVRQIPVGGRVIGHSVWLVAADPRHAGYVRNIDANPNVRVRVLGRWRTGTAHLLPDDNARRRMFQINPLNGVYIAIAARDHLTIRVDLDQST